MKKYVFTAVFLFAAVIAVFAICFYFSDDEQVKTTRSVFAFDTLGEITIYGNNKSAADDAVKKINELSGKLNGFDEASTLYKLNRTKEISDKDIYNIVSKSVSLYENYGFVDITIGELIYLWDINGENPVVPTSDEIKSALETTGISNITLENEKITLSGGTTLELGAVAKGYLLNELKDILKGSESALVNFGSSILLYGDKTFKIDIKNPFEQSDILGTLELCDSTISTSGDYERFFEADGKKYSHILDAKTGYPVKSDLASVSVICDDGLTGDFLSTAAYIMGSKELLKIADKLRQEEIYILAVTKNNEILVSKELKDKLTLKNNSFKLKII